MGFKLSTSSADGPTLLFADFKRNTFLQVKGSSVKIKDRRALEHLLQEN